MQELLDELEVLRIHDSDFFDVSDERRATYERANEMLDDCLEIVYRWFLEHK